MFTELTYHAAYDPQRAIRTPRWKYIRFFDDYDRAVLPNIDDSPSKDVFVEAGWGERQVPREQLYDVVLDPEEGNNLAADPAFEHVRADLAERLERQMRETDDPLLDGPVPAPRGRAPEPPGPGLGGGAHVHRGRGSRRLATLPFVSNCLDRPMAT